MFFRSGKFGSQVAGTPIKTKDIELIQTLAAWLDGLTDAVVNTNKAPYLEDINSVFYVFAYQLAYMLQEGTPEYNTDTTYFIGSIVKKTGTFELYGSLQDSNAGNALGTQADTAYWKYLGTTGTPLDGSVTIDKMAMTYPLKQSGTISSPFNASVQMESGANYMLTVSLVGAGVDVRSTCLVFSPFTPNINVAWAEIMNKVYGGNGSITYHLPYGTDQWVNAVTGNNTIGITLTPMGSCQYTIKCVRIF